MLLQVEQEEGQDTHVFPLSMVIGGQTQEPAERMNPDVHSEGLH